MQSDAEKAEQTKKVEEEKKVEDDKKVEEDKLKSADQLPDEGTRRNQKPGYRICCSTVHGCVIQLRTHQTVFHMHIHIPLPVLVVYFFSPIRSISN